jgi:putative sterol carrier protein
LAATRLTEDVMPGDLLARLRPEFVAPVVLYLCSEQCGDTGLILNAGGGSFGRAAVVSAPGIQPCAEGAVPTPEDIHRHWVGIDSLEGGQEYANANAALIDMLTPRETRREKTETEEQGEAAAGGQGDTVQGVFERMEGYFQADAAAGVDVVFQFSISGPGGGDWHVTVKDGACAVASGVHAKPTTTLRMSDEDFLQYVGGQLPAMQAYTSGRLKIEGDLMKSQLIERLFKW